MAINHIIIVRVKIIGHPGIGKSDIVKQAAGRKNYYFVDTRLAFKENIDLGGYPVPDHEEKQMIYYRPRFIPPQAVPALQRDFVVSGRSKQGSPHGDTDAVPDHHRAHMR